MLKTYCNLGCLLVIDPDGSIVVRQGDSIRKYSMAIHGDYEHLDEYYRKDGTCINRIDDTDQIFHNEKIYHKPSMPLEFLAVLKVQSAEIAPSTFERNAEDSKAIRQAARAMMGR